MLIDGKLYLGDEDGDVVIMQEGKTKKVIGEINMGSSVYSTPVPANGAMYISNRNQLYALAETPQAKPAAAPKVSFECDTEVRMSEEQADALKRVVTFVEVSSRLFRRRDISVGRNAIYDSPD